MSLARENNVDYGHVLNYAEAIRYVEIDGYRDAILTSSMVDAINALPVSVTRQITQLMGLPVAERGGRTETND